MSQSSLLVLALLCGSCLGHVMPWVPGKCLHPPLKEHFQPNRYFEGHWYQERSFGNYLVQGDGTCSATESKQSVSGQIDVINYHYEPLLQKYLYIRGHTDLGQFKSGTASFTVTYDALFGLANVKIPFSVVATDYVNYAVVYSCQQILGFKSEMSWIMTRRRDSKRFEEEIKKAVTGAGLNYESYSSEMNRSCGPDEPHV